jgi:hypothetical protein
MCSGVRLLPPILLAIVMLPAPRTVGFPHPSSQPAVTPATGPATSPKQTFPASPSPNPSLPVSSATPSAPSIRDRETVIRLKVFLDQHSFGPGEIDDRWNDLCANALRLYRTANGRAATDEIDPALRQQLSDLAPLYISYQIKPDDLAWVGKSPQRPAAQAKRKFMPYPSVADFVAERFHTNLSFLAKLNQGKSLSKLRPGDSVQVPNVSPFELSVLKEADDVPPRPELKTRTVEIDTKNKALTITDVNRNIADQGKDLDLFMDRNLKVILFLPVEIAEGNLFERANGSEVARCQILLFSKCFQTCHHLVASTEDEGKGFLADCFGIVDRIVD